MEDASASGIAEAIAEVGVMRALSGLSTTDISAIAGYIASMRGGSVGSGGGGEGCDDGCSSSTTNMQRGLAASIRNLSFGNEAVGSTSRARTVTLTNVTKTSVSLSRMTVSGDYALVGGSCAQGGSLAAGASCTVNVDFAPKTTGLRAGTLRVALASSPALTTITLQGRGTASTTAAATLSNTSLTFPSQPVMQSSGAQAVTLSNPAGGQPLALGGLAVIGPAARDFAVDSNCGSVLQPGAACVINVRYTPAGGAGTSSATLWVASDARGVIAADLHGTAVALTTAHPAAVAAAASPGVPASTTSAVVASSPVLSFDPLSKGASSGDLEVDLTNTGSTPVTLGEVKANGGDFTLVSDGCSGTTLASGASCAVHVRFSPQHVGQQSGTLTASTDGTDAPMVKLAGVGLEPQAGATTGATDASAQSGGGGAFAPWALLLAGAAAVRRRRRTARSAW